MGRLKVLEVLVELLVGELGQELGLGARVHLEDLVNQLTLGHDRLSDSGKAVNPIVGIGPVRGKT
jgi:hypothetical protein